MHHIPTDFPLDTYREQAPTELQLLESFCARFVGQQGYGRGHFVLACYAAFPVVMTPDLLYKLWMNFGKYRDSEGNVVHINAVAVTDLLLSPLFQAVRPEIYRMPGAVRQACMQYLRDRHADGENPMQLHSLEELAHFLLQYLQKHYIAETPAAKAFREAQEWSALAYLQPKLALHRLMDAFRTHPEKQTPEEKLRLTLALDQLVRQEKATKTEPEADTFSAFATFSEGWKAYLAGNRLEALEAFRQAKGNQVTLPVPKIVEEALQEQPTRQQSHLHLLLIAVDEYLSPLPQLQTCVADAQKVRDYLAGQYHIETERLLFNREVTRDQVLQELGGICRKAKTRDVVVVYFAGLGRNWYNAQNETEQVGLICSDFSEKNPEAQITEAAFAEVIQQNIPNNPSIALILDTNAGTQRWLDMRNDHHVILAACRLDQEAIELPDGQGGAFTHYLLRQLEANENNITYRRLFRQVQAHVRTHGNQNPQLFGSPRAVNRLFLSRRNSEVPRLQELLRENGYYQGAIDGHHEERTAAALEAFRKEYKLSEREDLLRALEQKILVKDAETVRILLVEDNKSLLYESLQRLQEQMEKIELDTLSLANFQDNFTENIRSNLSSTGADSAGIDLINRKLDEAHIIILPVAGPFLTEPLFQTVVAKAIEESQIDSKLLFPVLLEHCNWQNTDLRFLTVYPRNQRPFDDEYWDSPEEAAKLVLEDISGAAEQLARFVNPEAEARTFSLCIGIDAYANLPPLQGAVRDATEMAELLAERVPEDQLTHQTLIDSGGHRQQVLYYLTEYLSNARTDDLVFIYFAGHGLNQAQGSRENALLFQEYHPERNLEEEFTEQEFRKLVSEYATADPHIVLVLDTHSGSDGWLDTNNDKHLVISACTNAETVRENQGHGVFTNALIEHLRSAAFRLTYRRLISRIRRDIQKDYAQMPLLFGTEKARNRRFLEKEDDPAVPILEKLQEAGYAEAGTDPNNQELMESLLQHFVEECEVPEDKDIEEALKEKVLADRIDTLNIQIFTGYEPNRINAALSRLLDSLSFPVRAERYRPGQGFAASQSLSETAEVPGNEAGTDRVDQANLIILLIDDYFIRAEESAAIVQRILYWQQTEYLPVVPLLIEDCDWESHPVAQLPGMELYRMKGNFLNPEWIENTGMEMIREQAEGIGRYLKTPEQKAYEALCRQLDPTATGESFDRQREEILIAAEKLPEVRFVLNWLTPETSPNYLFGALCALQVHPEGFQHFQELEAFLSRVLEQEQLAELHINLLHQLVQTFLELLEQDGRQESPSISERQRGSLLGLLKRLNNSGVVQQESQDHGQGTLSYGIYMLIDHIARSLGSNLANYCFTEGEVSQALEMGALSPEEIALPQPVDAPTQYLKSCEKFDGVMSIRAMDNLGRELSSQAASWDDNFRFLIGRLRPDLFQGYIFGVAKAIEAHPVSDYYYFGPLLGFLDRISQTEDLNYNNLRLRVLYRLIMGMEAIVDAESRSEKPHIDPWDREKAVEVLQAIAGNPRAVEDAEKTGGKGLSERVGRVVEKLKRISERSGSAGTDKEEMEERMMQLRRAFYNLNFTPQMEAAQKIDISPQVIPVILPVAPAAGPGLLRDRLMSEFALPPEALVVLNINELAPSFYLSKMLQEIMDELRLEGSPELEGFAEAMAGRSTLPTLTIAFEDHRNLSETELRSFTMDLLEFCERIAEALRRKSVGGLRTIWFLLSVDEVPEGVLPEESYNWYTNPVVLPPVERVSREELAAWTKDLPTRDRELILKKFLPSYTPAYPLEAIRALCRELEAEDLYEDRFSQYEAPAIGNNAAGIGPEGVILYGIPQKLLLRTGAQCVIRLGLDRATVERGIRKTEEVIVKRIPVGNIMRVELIDPDSKGVFSIKTPDEQEQYIAKDDFSEWKFQVTPNRQGRFPLLLKVSAIVIEEGREQQKAVLEERIMIESRGIE